MGKAKPQDLCTDYANRVISGDIVAGPHVRAACQRHISDVKQQKKKGLFWDVAAAAKAMSFFPTILRLNGGQFEGKPFELLPWQQFVIGNLFGWKSVDDGFRRFRVAYIEEGKGSGKSPLVAGIGLIGLIADNEPRAEIYAAGTKKDQAMILYRDAVAMVDQSPLLSSRLKKSGTGLNVWNMAYMPTSSFFRPISSDDAQSGPRPHIALIDEVHEHKTDNVVEMMRAGTKFRRQALILMITNSGTDRHSVCWNYHEYGIKVASQVVEDDSFFSFICALDEGDDPFKDESCWPKANPSLQHGNIPGYKYIREQVREAKGIQGKESKVRRLNFCEWVDAASPWISGEVWNACGDDPVDESLLVGRKCYAGLDLSSTQDLTAFKMLFEPCEKDPFWRLVSRFWMPDDLVVEKAEHDHVPYDKWRELGFIKTTPGRANSKLAAIREIHRLNEKYNFEAVAYDRWRIADLIEFADEDGISIVLGKFNKKLEVWEYQGEGIKMRAYGQNYEAFSPAIDKFETFLINKEIRHDNNPVLRWNAASSVIVERDDFRKFSKSKATGRIDGIVAATMAVGICGQKTFGNSDSVVVII